MRSNYLLLILFFALIGQAQAQPLQQGEYMPDFEFCNGNRLFRSGDLNGKLVIVNFWASWCGPCRKELVYIQDDLYNRYRYDSRVVLLIFGVGETARSLNAYQYHNNLDLPMYADTEKEIYRLFGDNYFPSTFIISPDGKIYFHSTGFPGSLDEINQQINGLLR